MIRSFEVPIKKKSKDYNVHFHFLIAGKNEKEIKLFGKTITQYWCNYFGKDANHKAQYLEKQRKSELENFKYLLKLDDVTDSNIHMLYHLLKATHGRRLFEKMNIKATKVEKDRTQQPMGEIINFYYYSTKIRNYYNSDSKELLENEKLIKDAKRVKIERKNAREVTEYFKEVSNQKHN